MLHYNDIESGSRDCHVWVMGVDFTLTNRLKISVFQGLCSVFWVLDEGVRVLTTFGTLELYLNAANVQHPLALDPSWYHHVFGDYFNAAQAHHFVESLLLLPQGAPMHLKERLCTTSKNDHSWVCSIVVTTN